MEFGKSLLVKDRKSVNIFWEIAVDTLTKSSDRWWLINCFSFYGSRTQLLLFSRRNFREIPWKSSDHTPYLCAVLALLLLRKRVTFSSLTTTNPSAVIFSPNNREPKEVITWDRDELRPVRICNFCSRLHESGTKRFVDYMRQVQTQKQEILVAI